MKRGNTAAASTYTGPLGELLVDTGLQTIRIQDGVTPGGMSILATNAQVWALSNSVSSISGIDTTLLANAATQQSQINTINANLGSYQSYANATFGTSSFGNANVALYLQDNPQGGTTYSNSNVASYLPTSSIILGINANITAANATINGLTSNAAIQAALLDTLTSNAATQSTVLDTLTSNAAAQSFTLDALLGNAVVQQNTLIALIANAGVQADLIANASGDISSLVNGAATFQLFANGQSRSPDTIFASNGVSIIDTNGAIQGGIYRSGDADWFNIGASTGRGFKFYVNEEDAGPQFFANGSVNVPNVLYSDSGVIGDVGMYGGTIWHNDPSGNYLTLTHDIEGYSYVQIPSDATANVANLRIHNDIGNIEIGTGDGLSYYNWYFRNDGDLNLPTNGDINFNGGGIGQTINEDFTIRVQDEEDDGWSLFQVVDDGAGNNLGTTRLQRDNFAVSFAGGSQPQFRFADNGELQLPGNVRWDYPYINHNLYAVSDNNGDGSIELKTQSYSNDTLGTNIRASWTHASISTNNAQYSWVFDNTGNLTIPGNINYANGTSILSGISGGGNYGDAQVQALLASNVSLIGSSSNITLATLGAESTTTVSHEGGGAGYGVNTITGSASNSPGFVLVQPGWTVTGNNLVGTTTVISKTIDGYGAYTITTDTAEVDPFWYQDVYTFTSNTPSYSNLTVSSGNIINAGTYGQINFVANSSGDGNGYSTIRMIPDTNLEGTDQYLIIDPTAPGHIHIRAGGTQDSSAADLILGGENSHVKITSGPNPPVYILANNQSWTFTTDGVLQAPGEISTAGNVTTDYVRVTGGIITQGASPAPVISGFSSITTTGSAENEGNISASGNLVASRNAYVTGNVFAARYNFANGISILSNLASTSYVDTQITNLVNNAPALLDTLGEIAANLATESNAVGSVLNSLTNTNANVTAANVGITNLQSNAASQQTSIDTLLGQVNQAVNTTSSPQFAGLTTTANVELTANVHIHQNLIVDGNINFIGNVTQTNITTANAVFTGDTYGFGALYAGVLGYTPLPYTVIQATSDYNDYSQINFQNLNLSANASTEWVATAGNGTDLTNYIDFGIAGGAWNGTQLNSVGTAAKANDGWVYVLGNTAAGTGGNLVLGTIQSGKRVNILTGGPGSGNIYSYFNSSGLTTTNVYATNYLYANGTSILTGVSGTYSNTNVAGYLAGNITTGNIQVGNALKIHGLDNSISTLNGSAISINNRVNITGSAVNIGLSVSGNLVVNQNSNATSFYGTNYYYSNGVSILSGISGTYSNTNVEAYIGGNIGAFQIFSNANSATQATSINSINANVGAYQIWANGNFGTSTYSNTNVEAYIGGNIGSYQIFANANLSTQTININTINANLGAFQTYANATFTGGGGGSTYSNTNVAAYLSTATVTTTGNVTAANLITTGNVYTSNIVTTGSTSGNISGANYISANVFQVSTGIFWANGTAWSSSGGGTTYTSTGAGNITVSGSTLALTATGPAASAVGSSTAIPVITPDGYGRIASLTTAAVVAPAGTLSGTTLAATVVTSSLTSVGTLSSLAVTGNVTAANVGVTQISATTGVYSGNITAANIITTGTYGNITGANVISANTVTVTTFVRTQAVTFSTLPTAAVAGAGARAFVTDGNTATFAGAVSGGGANSVPVYSDGTNWRVG